MAVNLEDLIRQGVFDIELNVNDPRTTGVEAGDGAMGKAIDGTRWVKIGPNDTDWEQLLITTDGSFVANIELADVTLITPPQNVLGVKDGALTLGDGSTQGGVEIISASSTGHSSFTFVGSGAGNTTIKTDTSFPADAYNANNAITSIIFSDRVTSIGDNAFRSATNLRGDLFIPNSVESIGAYAFKETGFDGKIVLTENPSYTKIEERTFEDMPNLTGDLTIPDNIIEIGASAFYGTYCGNLTLSNNLKVIESNAFEASTITGDLILPDSIETINSASFGLLGSFNGQLVLSQNPLFTDIPNAAITMLAPNKITGNLLVPNNIETMSQNSLYGLDVDTLTISENLTTMSSDSFVGTANRVDLLAPVAPSGLGFSSLTITEGLIHVPVGATGYSADYNGNTVVYDL